MSSVNKVIIVGNCTRDPEIRAMNNGGKVVNMSVATSEKWKDKQSGEWKEKSEFHNVVIWNEHLAKIAENYLKKGSRVYLEGALQTRKWTDNNGQDKYTTEIVLNRFKGELTLLDKREQQGNQQSNQHQNTDGMGGNPGYSGGSGGDSLDDEIPFSGNP